MKNSFVLIAFVFFLAISFANTPYKISNYKFDKAKRILDSIELKVNTGVIANQTVIPNVSLLNVCYDIRSMLNKPNSTCIGNIGHYCGPAAIINWYINCCPDKYVNDVVCLAQDGIITRENSGTKLKLPRYIKKKVNFQITDTIDGQFMWADIDSISLSDFILISSLVNAEKGIQKVGLISKKAIYKKRNVSSFIYTNTMPWEMDDYLKFLNINTKEQGYYINSKKKMQALNNLETAVKNGQMPIIFDNHFISFAQTKNWLYRTIGAHFITLHSFKVNVIKNTVDYSFWDYGDVKNNPHLTYTPKFKRTGNLKKDMRQQKKFRKKKIALKQQTITTDEFIKAMKGYWIPEI